MHKGLNFALRSIYLQCFVGLVASAYMKKLSFRVGVVFCGRQSPGGHNVICGLYDAIKSHNPKSTLIGFRGAYLSRLVISWRFM